MANVGKGCPQRIQRQFESLGIIVQRTAGHQRLLKGLAENLDAVLGPSYSSSKTFWNFVAHALKTTIMLGLAKVLDLRDKKNTVTLSSLLKTVRDTPAVLVKAELTKEEVDLDIARISDTNPLVNRLVKLRNNYLVHLDSEFAAGNVPALRKLDFDKNDIDKLVELMVETFNKYSLACHHVEFSPKWVDEGDYWHLLRYAKIGYDTEVEREHRELGEALNRKFERRLRKSGAGQASPAAPPKK